MSGNSRMISAVKKCVSGVVQENLKHPVSVAMPVYRHMAICFVNGMPIAR